MCILVWSMQVVSESQRGAEVMGDGWVWGPDWDLQITGSEAGWPQESSLLTGMYDCVGRGRSMGYAHGVGHKDWAVQL